MFSYGCPDLAGMGSMFVVAGELVSQAIAIAHLTAGWTMGSALPFGNRQRGEGGTGYERFLGFQTVTGTAALTAGSVNAFLTNSQYGWTAYPDGNN